MTRPFETAIFFSRYRWHAILVLWGYDVVKILMIYKTLVFYNMNPWIFFFIDVVTVPPFIIGWNRLFASLTGNTDHFGTILMWGLITFAAGSGPYLYVAWAGRESLPAFVWIILAGVMIFPFINLFKKIRMYKAKSGALDPQNTQA